MQDIEGLIAPEAVKHMREEIARTGGNEVFFVGELSGSKGVQSVRVAARGNSVSAPAIMAAASSGEVVIHNHPSGELKPSQADVSVASALGNCGVGFYIVNNEVTSAYVVVEALSETAAESLDAGELISLLEPGGLISRKLRGYENRPQQGAMTEAVARAFNRDGIALVEAGTGTGKTMAYLIPAIRWAVNNRERVVVSTHTINLQEQLIHKDIPFLRRALSWEFKAAQVIGRGNYVCLRKASSLEREPDLLAEPGEMDALNVLLAWAKNSSTGCRTELTFVPAPALWEKLSSESDYCMGARCPDQKRCFVNAARRKAAAADLLVVNHHLLFADMALRKITGAYSDLAVLPPYRRLIVDEAHTLEDVATSYFGTQMTRLGLARMLGRLYTPAAGGKGLLPYIMATLRKHVVSEGNLSEGGSSAAIMRSLEQRTIPALRELVDFSNAAFDAVLEETSSFMAQDYPEPKLRLTPRVVGSKRWQELLRTEISELTVKLKGLAVELSDMAKRIERAAGDTMADQCFDLKVYANHARGVAADLLRILSGGDPNEVAWVEGRFGGRGANVVRLLSSPVDVAHDLAENLFDRIPTVVLTSATLAVENRFAYLKSRLGLDPAKGWVEEERVEELLLSSPFHYQSQAIIGIPTDMPEPGGDDFDDSLTDVVYRTIEVTGGKAFVLFTSYKSLDQAHDRLKEPLAALGISALRQGERPAHQLLEAFRKDKTSVLFATDTFWQGVDVEGEALECVILAKLPFRVPTDPVFEARCQFIDEQGGSSFLEYVVPQTVIKFKQGFGRLIRKRTDRGAVLILDRRIVEKPYGKTFMRSLPPSNTVVGSVEQVLEAIRVFFEEGK